MPEWDLASAIGWLDGHIDLEAITSGRARSAGIPTLSRIQELCGLLGEPQHAAPAVHITGTNGKGSTARMVSALLAAHGLRVGTYTSPDLESVNERIAYCAKPIGDAPFAELLGHLAVVESAMKERATRFELLTAAAFRHFADLAADAMVVEVGLGGTWDATNVVDADVAVLTNVDLDHTEILGGTEELIAVEKAGIVKAGSAVVVGRPDRALADAVAARARAVVPRSLWNAGEEFRLDRNVMAHGGRLIDCTTPNGRYEDVFVGLHGPHQGVNAAGSIAAVEAFFGRRLDGEVVREAFATVTVPGRLEITARRPLVVLDGAHNTAGAHALGVALAEEFSWPDEVTVVMGVLAGRRPAAMLDALDLGDRLAAVVCCRPGSPRALDVHELACAVGGASPETMTTPDPVDALETARDRAGPDGMVLVFGSLYLVGAVRAAALGGGRGPGGQAGSH